MFGAKRKPRKISQDEEEGGDIRVSEIVENGEQPVSTIIRPSSASRSSSKAKQKSAIRTSFGLSGTSMNDDDDDDSATAVFIPKKSSLSRQALEKSTLRKSLATSIQSEEIRLRQTEDRPSYNADALNELKSSTPSTPRDLKSHTDLVGSVSDLESNPNSRELDLAAKFGSNLAFTQDATIPTEAEIREKKERRARLAKEHEYISLNDREEEQPDEDSDDEFKDRSLQRYAETKPAKYEETRLVRDDEDTAEGFDDFVEDGRIALGRKAEKEAKKRLAAEMREMIEKAEGHDDSSEDDSEAERNAAYEAAQTRAGMDGMRKENTGAKARRPRTPPKITPLPSLAGCAERLKGELDRKKALKEQKKRRLEEVRQELEDVAVRKVELQRLLDEAGARYQRLRAEADELQDEEATGREIPADTQGELGGGHGSGDLMAQTMGRQTDLDDPSERFGLGMEMGIS